MSEFLNHFRFNQPAWLLLLLPALLVLVLRRGRGATSAITFPNLSALIALGLQARQRAWNFGVPLIFSAIILATLAMARPVWRNQYQSRTASGIDIMIAFDVSLSMTIDDFLSEGRPIKRIDVAKDVVDRFIARRPDDRIGLVAFAGRPVSISPITLDHDWLRSGLEGLRLNDKFDNGTVQEQGTAIGSALSASAIRLDARDAKSKVIVLVTDGASNSGKIAPIEAAQEAKVLGIRIYTVAIGTKEGRVSGSIQPFPRQEFDIPTLSEIARITGGEHFWAQTLTELEKTFTSIDNLEKTESKALLVIEDKELFPGFLIASLLAALAASCYLALNPPPSAA